MVPVRRLSAAGRYDRCPASSKLRQWTPRQIAEQLPAAPGWIRIGIVAVQDAIADRLNAMVTVFNRAESPPSAGARLSQFAVPGDVATRSRWRFLLDPHRAAISAAPLVPETPEAWQTDIDLETRAEQVQIASGAAAELWDELLARERQDYYRIVTVNALLGRADDHRRQENHPAAAETARLAQTIAHSFGYRFGVMRAEIIRGYIDLMTPAGHEAARRFADAAAIAKTLDEPLYEANAWLGRGQVHLARGRTRPALAYARKAMRRFKQLGSSIGVANAQTLMTAAGAPAPDSVSDEHGDRNDIIGEIEGLIATADQLFATNQMEQAANIYGAAKDRAEGIYPRGEAHAWLGLGRILESVGEDELAADAFAEAAKIYEGINDTTGTAYSNVALSGTASRRGALSASLAHDQRAIIAIESLLNEDPHSASQTELSQRFSTVYVHAIRNALAHNDADALLLALENLAGRRLTGIASKSVGNVAEAWLTSGIAAIAAERRAGRHRSAAPDPDPDPEKELRRRIGRVAIAHGMPEIAGRNLESAVLGHHEPVTPDVLSGAVASLPIDAQVLVISPVPETASEIVWWQRSPGGSTTVGHLDIDDPARKLITRLATQGLSGNVFPADLAPLACLLPETAKQGILSGAPLIVVALGRLSSVPWLALPIADRMLGELVPTVRCPTLMLYRDVTSRNRPDQARRESIALWRNPTVRWTRFSQLEHSSRWRVFELEGAVQARRALQTPTTDVVAIACHGRPTEGIGHYLDLGDNVYLTAADCLMATPPSTVALVSCWGAGAPTSAGRDPLSIANVLLAKGSRNVLATTSELADSPQAGQIIDDFLYDLATTTAPTAYQSAISRYLRRPEHRRGRLWHWAPASVFGVL